MSADESEAQPTVAMIARQLAHDLRSPVGVIAGVLDEIANVPEAAAMAALARRSTHRLDWMARRMDWLSVATSAKATSLDETGVTPLGQAIGAAVRVAGSIGSRRDVSLVFTSEADPSSIAHGRLWRHVCEELLLNALRHARARVEVRIEPHAAGAGVIVEDDGSGVSEARLAALFSPSSSGLGLYLAHRLARAAGGELRHEATPVGARFVMDIPSV